MWRPLASTNTLRERARVVKQIRAYFDARNVLEVDVPIIAEAGVTDPYLDALTIDLDGREHYLQTSPEYFMKRLLAAGSGDIYYLGKAFRKDENSRKHNVEFTMLVWYRLGMDDHQLMDEVCQLVRVIQPDVVVKKSSYEELFAKHLGVNPHLASASDLECIAKTKLDVHWQNEPKSTWLDLLFSHCIEPKLNDSLYAVYDYPECQSALAKTSVTDKGYKVAKRFEFFLFGVELANGYFELTDVNEQKNRFKNDNTLRKTLGKKEIPIDNNFIEAVTSGLPSCSGVALGVDRLVMCVLGLRSIHEQRSF